MDGPVSKGPRTTRDQEGAQDGQNVFLSEIYLLCRAERSTFPCCVDVRCWGTAGGNRFVFLLQKKRRRGGEEEREKKKVSCVTCRERIGAMLIPPFVSFLPPSFLEHWRIQIELVTSGHGPLCPRPFILEKAKGTRRRKDETKEDKLKCGVTWI